jgi:hypothetical protein
MPMIDPERAACAHDFLTKILTSRERMLVAAFALGYCQRDVAAAWGVSAASVCQMARRIQAKAQRYWVG